MSLLIATPGPRDAADDGAHEPRPELPRLTALLARARPLASSAGWHAGVLDALGVTGADAIADVAVAARTVRGIPSATPLCFAAPLHMVAGISRVHLPPGGCLRLEADESESWRESFNREFGGPGLRMHGVPGGWLLEAQGAVAARDPAPEDITGRPLSRVAARDGDERALRRLGAEAEIWLASHPLNRAREARQLPPVNSLWFWGGGRATALPAATRAPRVLAVAGEVGPWIAGLSVHCGVSPRPVSGWNELDPSATTVLVVQPSLEPGDAHWRTLEAQWIAPAADALRAGLLDTLRLQIGTRAWRLPDHSPLRWLRRRRPWYQQVAA